MRSRSPSQVCVIFKQTETISPEVNVGNNPLAGIVSIAPIGLASGIATGGPVLLNDPPPDEVEFILSVTESPKQIISSLTVIVPTGEGLTMKSSVSALVHPDESTALTI